MHTKLPLFSVVTEHPALTTTVIPSRRNTVYVSQANGTDGANCGSQDAPCKTLVHSLSHLVDKGSLFLDGTGSKKHPYTCNSSKPILIKMTSLTISNWYAKGPKANVSCEISFQWPSPDQTDSTPSDVTELRVALKNLSFVKLGRDKCGVRCIGSCSVEVSDSIFSDCETALGLRLNRSSLHLNIKNTTFYRNLAAIDITSEVPVVIYIGHSNFRRNGRKPVLQININTIDNDTQIEIRDCIFQENLFSEAYLIAILSQQSPSVGVVTFHKNDFLSNAGSICVNGCFDSTFENLSMNDTFTNALTIINRLDCPRRIAVQMKHCLINGTLANRDPYSMLVMTEQITMSMDNVTMQFIKGNAFYYSTKNGTLCINNSMFAKNSATNKEGLLLISGKMKCNDGLTDLPGVTKNEQIFRADDLVKVDFQNTIFSSNAGLASIIRLCHTSARFLNVAFKDNIVEGRGGDIYIGNNNTVSLLSSRFTRANSHCYNPSAFVYSDLQSYSSLSVHDSSFEPNCREFKMATVLDLRSGIKISTDNTSSITCLFDRVLQSTINVTTSGLTNDDYKASCKRCQVGFYSLERVFFITDAAVNTERCLPCPYGGNCSKGIVARPNFWGYRVPNHPPTVVFSICPLEYCVPNVASKVNSTYNSCCGYRSGILCGRCREGYTEAMFSTECRDKETCNDYLFWFFSVAYVVCLSFLLMKRPPLFEFLWKNIVWFRYRDNSNSPRYTTVSNGHSCNGKAHFDHALVKTIFYFYQIVELLLLTTSSEDLMNRLKFIRPLVSVFNFKIQSWNERFGCPFPGLTAVTKQLFSSLKVLGTIACISLTCLIHKAMSYVGCISRPRISLYLAAGVETLLLGYERLTEVSLSLLKCVPVHSESRLFLDGNIRCWQWWQYALISYIGVFVVPFIFVLYWGSRKLHQQSVSTIELALACIMPLPLLFYWSIRYCFKNELASRRLQEDNEDIAMVLQAPFRQPVEDDEGTLYWESVLIGRRLVLLLMHSFTADPMLRLLSLDFACMAIFMHHLCKKPYRDTIVNACESISLVALVVIATFSLTEASLVSEGIEVSGPVKTVFRVFEWIELALLVAAPACLCLLVSLAVMSQLFRLFFHIIMLFREQLPQLKLHRKAQFSALRRPLLLLGR